MMKINSYSCHYHSYTLIGLQTIYYWSMVHAMTLAGLTMRIILCWLGSMVHAMT